MCRPRPRLQASAGARSAPNARARIAAEPLGPLKTRAVAHALLGLFLCPRWRYPRRWTRALATAPYDTSAFWSYTFKCQVSGASMPGCCRERRPAQPPTFSWRDPGLLPIGRAVALRRAGNTHVAGKLLPSGNLRVARRRGVRP